MQWAWHWQSPWVVACLPGMDQGPALQRNLASSIPCLLMVSCICVYTATMLANISNISNISNHRQQLQQVLSQQHSPWEFDSFTAYVLCWTCVWLLLLQQRCVRAGGADCQQAAGGLPLRVSGLGTPASWRDASREGCCAVRRATVAAATAAAAVGLSAATQQGTHA